MLSALVSPSTCFSSSHGAYKVGETELEYQVRETEKRREKGTDKYIPKEAHVGIACDSKPLSVWI